MTHERATCALVLAGGRGTRLKQLTDACAKPALAFGGRMRLIDFTLGNCVNSGIRQIAVLAQYRSRDLIRHVTGSWSPLATGPGEFIDVVPPQDRQGQGGYAGTADAVFQNLALVRDTAARFVLVLAGDHVYRMDYRCILRDHVERQADVTVACIALPVEEASAFGVMRVDADDRVRAFEEKPTRASASPGQGGTALVSMGVYVFDASVLDAALTRDARDPDSSHDFGHDVLPDLVRRARVVAHRFERSGVEAGGAPPYWRDVGSLDAYWQAHMDLACESAGFPSDDAAWPLGPREPRLPPARFATGAQGQGVTIADSVVAGGCRIEGATIRGSVLSSRVRVGSGSTVEASVLMPGVVAGRNVVLRRAIVDAGCVLPDGLRVGLGPAEDRGRFTVTDGGVTLVTADMLAPGAPVSSTQKADHANL